MQETPQYQSSRYQQDEENFFQELASKYLPYWPLFGLLISISAFGAFTYLRYAPPIYESNASILIKDEKKGMDETKMLEALNLFGPKKIVENEIEILQSRTLLRQVATKLCLYAPIAEEGRIHSQSGYTTSPIIVEAKSPDSLVEVKKVYFTYDSTSNTVGIGNERFKLNIWYESRYGTLRFLPNPNFVGSRKDKKLFFSLTSLKKATSALLAKLKVTASSKQSTVIDLAYQDEEFKRGDDILNNLISVYNKAAVEDKNALASNTLHFVEDRLKYVVNELDSVESQLQQYKARNKIVDMSEQGKMFLENVGDNDKKASELSMQLAVLDQVESYVLSKNNKAGIVPSALGVTDPVLMQLLQHLYESELQYEKYRSTTAENNPIVITLKEQVDKLRPSVLENVRNQRRSLEAGRNDILRTNSKFTSMLATMPQKERELLEISRQQAIKNNIYTFLLQKREETALSYASTVADSRIVDESEAHGPVSPKQALIYLIALALALLLGSLIIVVKENWNRKVLFRSEIEKYTTVPILGEVMKEVSGKGIVIAEGKRTLIAEQFRHLRTSLGYLGINSRKKRILITSTISGEGKSFVATNLSISLALMGKKVVLIELDLRKPKICEPLGVERAPGLSGYLIGEQEAEQIIKKTSVNTNLFIIPSGPLPPNPSELIMNGKLQELLTYLDGVFDYVIIDTAPVRPVTDAYILSPLCDATLYVVRHDVTPKSQLQRLDEQTKINDLKNLAIIFNGIKQRGFGGYGYGYGYGSYGYSYGNYGYGEGYTQEETPAKKVKNSVRNKA